MKGNRSDGAALSRFLLARVSRSSGWTGGACNVCVSPYPRAYGAFARLSDYYLDDSGNTDHQLLVRHLSTNAADAYRLDQRGRLAQGKAADICVLAPPGLIERSSFDDPCRLADGAALVLVNGVPVWADGAPVDAAQPGRVVTS